MPKYEPHSTDKCPNCLNSVRFEFVAVQTTSAGSHSTSTIYVDAPSQNNKEVERLSVTTASCPACGKVILTIEPRNENFEEAQVDKEYVVWPLRSARPIPKEVPMHIRADYEEAALVLNLSAKASAALSRRCLQAVLREEAKANQHNLIAQIEAVIPNLPSYIAESIDAVRNIGNFAAHPTKSETSGELIGVEPGEAEWNLDVLDLLFDFYYVQPAKVKEKRSALDKKLASAGKPAVKTASEKDK
jgi:hypothetical protein